MRPSHLNDLRVFFAPLCGDALHTAKLLGLCVGEMHRGPRAADELRRVQGAGRGLHLQGLRQGPAVAGRVHHHGLGAGVDLCLHHGDLQDVRHGGLVLRGARAGLGDQLGCGLAAAEDRRGVIGAAEGDLGYGGTLSDDRLLWWR